MDEGAKTSGFDRRMIGNSLGRVRANSPQARRISFLHSSQLRDPALEGGQSLAVNPEDSAAQRGRVCADAGGDDVSPATSCHYAGASLKGRRTIFCADSTIQGGALAGEAQRFGASNPAG